MSSHIWKFVHNALVHGLLMSWPWEPEWVTRLHDWTGRKWGEREVKGGEIIVSGHSHQCPSCRKHWYCTKATCKRAERKCKNCRK